MTIFRDPSAPLLRGKYEPAAETERADFGLMDAKGRRIGYVTTFTKVTWSVSPEPWGRIAGGLAQPGAVVFTADTHCTRDGKMFGAATPDLAASTLEEVRRLATERMNAARARYAKTCKEG